MIDNINIYLANHHSIFLFFILIIIAALVLIASASNDYPIADFFRIIFITAGYLLIIIGVFKPHILLLVFGLQIVLIFSLNRIVYDSIHHPRERKRYFLSGLEKELAKAQEALNKDSQDFEAAYKRYLTENENLQKDKRWFDSQLEELNSKKFALEKARKKFEQEKSSFKETIDSLDEREKFLELREHQLEYREKFLNQMEDELYTQQITHNGVNLFQNCNNPSDLLKRRRALISIFHPDNPTGDDHITQYINSEYERLKDMF